MPVDGEVTGIATRRILPYSLLTALIHCRVYDPEGKGPYLDQDPRIEHVRGFEVAGTYGSLLFQL